MIEAMLEAGTTVRGYTFFHQQDTDSAVEGHGICLNYGSVDEGEAAALQIGREVVRALSRHGLQASWDGSWERRIQVMLVWQKRRYNAAMSS